MFDDPVDLDDDLGKFDFEGPSLGAADDTFMDTEGNGFAVPSSSSSAMAGEIGGRNSFGYSNDSKGAGFTGELKNAVSFTSSLYPIYLNCLSSRALVILDLRLRNTLNMLASEESVLLKVWHE